MIGYMIEQELGNLLPFERPFATLLTMIEVDPADPAFSNPTKFIGPVYDKDEADRLAEEKGWVFKQDGDKWRRVVASPEPKRIFELRPIKWLLERNTIVIAAGGGGIPTMYEPGKNRKLAGVECVIDKDLASELLARELDADLFVHADRRRGGVRRLGQTDAEGDPARLARRPQRRCRSPPARWGRRSMRPADSPRRPARSAAIGALADLESDHRGRGRHDDLVEGIRHCLRCVNRARREITKSLGLAACTAIVVGNMVGSGFYLSPSAVAPYGLLAILAWIVMGIGAVCLGLTFARLARMAPATGGPYAYTRAAYGDFAGFLVAWGYWISIWASLPVIAVAFTGSFLKLMPSLQGNRSVAVAITLGAIWLVALLNLRGVKEAGVFAEVTTYTKLVPFAAIAVVGLLFIRRDLLGGFNPSGQSLLDSSAALAPLTMFAYLGLESATVPAGDVRDPELTIPRSTMLGILVAALLYVLGTIVVMGVVPREQLIASTAPFADAARMMWGSWAATVIAFAVMLSSLGALNGWTLMMGQVPMAAAADQVFPAVFGHLSPRGVPAVGIMISAALATVLVLVQTAGTSKFAAIYDLIVSLSTMAAVIPYVFCSLAPGLIAGPPGSGRPRITIVEIVAFVFAMFTVYGCGPQPVLYGLVLLLLGLPVYTWQRRERMSAALTIP